MRFRTPLFALAFTLASFALPYAAHASIPFFGPIVPNSSTCAAGWGMIIVVINNLISFLITVAIVFIAPLMIAYAGFLFVVNPVNSSGISKAKDILLNTVIGIVLALAGYLIVDALMAVLYNGKVGSWAQIINWNGDQCLPQLGTQAGAEFNQAPPIVTGGSGGTTGGNVGQCSSSNEACSPAALIAAGFTQTQANVMSCIATTENRGLAVGCNGNACGTFQIMLTRNRLIGPACGGVLNCPVLCKGANGAAVRTASCQPCVQAANTPACNAQAAKALYDQSVKSGYSGYADWTPPRSDNQNAGLCVQKYGI